MRDDVKNRLPVFVSDDVVETAVRAVTAGVVSETTALAASMDVELPGPVEPRPVPAAAQEQA